MILDLGPITNNEAVELRELVRSPKVRAEKQLYIAEGPHLIQSALEFAKKDLVEIYATEEARSEQAEIITSSGKRIRSISQKNAERIAETATTQGLFALMKMPESVRSIQPSIMLALDDVQDPGNVGTIIRTAAWFGVYDLLVTAATADAYSPKVLRATQGAIFSAHVTRVTDLAARLSTLKQAGYSVVSATLDNSAITLSKFKPTNRMILVLGSEAHGISKSVDHIADKKIYIPKFGKGESLNVAISCGIILEKLAASNLAG